MTPTTTHVPAERRRVSLRSSSRLTTPVVSKRDDVVVRKGLFTLVNTDRTPQEAMVDDLHFVADTLDAAHIPYLLVRGNDERPVLAIAWKHRGRLTDALAEACAAEPFYAKDVDHRGSTPVLLSEGRLGSRDKSRAFVLYRPRVTPDGQLRFGAATGVRVELWKRQDGAIHAPGENSLMRSRLPRDEVEKAHVERYGRRWRTLQGMFEPHASDISFDIDLVFSWVDGASIEWQRARAKRMESYVVGEGDTAEARYRQIDELRYALRSVHLFAPWIRRIFIVTDSPVPAWLDDHEGVTIVRSEDFFPDLSMLPTHNSHAIEAQLHHIPGLSEHFLYSNDDMFFGRPVTPDMFFSPGGITKFIEATTRIGLGENNTTRSGFENAARVNRRLLRDKFGPMITRHLEHTAAPLTKTVMRELEREFPEDFRRTAASAFRTATDISVTNSLYHYYALMTGRATTQTTARVRYVDTTMWKGLRELERMLDRRDYDFFCLNDGSFPEVEAAERATAVVSFLERYYPIPAPWEKRGIDAVPASDRGELAL